MLFIMNASVIYVSEYHYIYVIYCGVRGIKIGLHVYNDMFVNVLLYLPLFYAISQCTNNKSNSDATYPFLDNAFLFSDSTCFLEKWGNVMAYFKSHTSGRPCVSRFLDMNGNANV